MSVPALLVLADGTQFKAKSMSPPGFACGEVVFNTSHTGYQEILTDPSYAEQIIVFTHPHIGNVGVNKQDMESCRMHANGAIFKYLSHTRSNWRANNDLTHFLAEQNKLALNGIDTRALTHYLCDHGAQVGCIMVGEINPHKAKEHANAFTQLTQTALLKSVSTKQVYQLNPSVFKYHIVVLDFGVKQSILQALLAQNCRLTVVPFNTTAEEIIALHPDGIVLSNGPGDPAACISVLPTIKALLTTGLPLLAICLGHQLLGLASGATTKKMLFGHHGANHPLISAGGRVAISSQNHGFTIADDNLPKTLQITHRSLFDNTIAGISRIDVPAFGIQGHPEAGPGPLEMLIVFEKFIAGLKQCHAKAS